MKRERASPEEVQRSVDALFAYWRAGIKWHIATRSKRRKPSDAKVSAMLASLTKGDLVDPLLREIQAWERYVGKPASQWTTEEKLQAARFAAAVLDEVRAQVFEKPRGRPSRRALVRGIINREITEPTPAPSVRRAERERTKHDLIRFAAITKLRAYAARQAKVYMRTGVSEQEATDHFGSLKAAKRAFAQECVDLDDEARIEYQRDVERALSDRKTARVFTEAHALPKEHDQRIRKQIMRQRRQILAALKKLLKQ